MRLKIAATALALGACATLAPLAAHAEGTNTTPVPLPQSVNRPCPQEDSTNCYWNAATRGNHTGHSFIVREFPGRADMICVMYIARADARKWDYCQAMHTQLPPVSCHSIDGSEFPRLAGLATRICWENWNRGARPVFLGRYDGKARVWAIGGPTTIFLTRAGWFETS